jgi:hypothetical protein
MKVARVALTTGGFMKFRTKVLQAGKTATGVQVPEKVVTALGGGKRPPVRVTINDYTYRSTVAPMGGKFMLGISAVVREAAHVAGGDEVDVTLELDTAPREVTLPSDFQKVLNKDAQAKQFFAGLSYSKKKALVSPIEQAKTPETRQRRIAKALSTLREGNV